MTDPHIALRWPNLVDPALLDSQYAAIIGEGVNGNQYTATLAQITGVGGAVVNLDAYGGADGTDFGTAMNRALAALPAGGGTVNVPSRVYTGAVTITPPVVADIRGASRIRIVMAGGAVAKYTGTTDQFLLSNAPGQDGYISIEGGCLDGVSAGASANGIRVDTYNFRLIDTVVRRFAGNGIKFTTGGAASAIFGIIHRARLLLNGVGLRADGGTTVNGLQLLDTWIEASSAEGMILGSCGGVQMTGGGLENNGSVTTTAPHIRITGPVWFMGRGVYLEDNPAQDHSMVIIDGSDATTAGAVIGVVFDGGSMVGYNVGTSTVFDIGPTAANAVFRFSASGCVLGESKTHFKIGDGVRNWHIGQQSFLRTASSSTSTLVTMSATAKAAGTGTIEPQQHEPSDFNGRGQEFYSDVRTVGAMVYEPRTPNAITTTTNDWAINGVSFVASRSFYRVQPSGGAQSVTGLVAGKDGQFAIDANVGVANLTYKHQDAGSVAANRFYGIAAADVVLAPQQSLGRVYDATSGYWRILWKN